MKGESWIVDYIAAHDCIKFRLNNTNIEAVLYGIFPRYTLKPDALESDSLKYTKGSTRSACVVHDLICFSTANVLLDVVTELPDELLELCLRRELLAFPMFMPNSLWKAPSLLPNIGKVSSGLDCPETAGAISVWVALVRQFGFPTTPEPAVKLR